MDLRKLYVVSSAAFAVATFLLVSSSPTMHRCLARMADQGSISALSPRPNVVLYSAYKGFLWPVSLVNSVAFGGLSFGDWLLNRYDPFPDLCR